MSEARVEFPNASTIFHFASVMHDRYPSLLGMFGFIDGLRLELHPCAESDMENAYYNGYTHDHYVSNVFLFTPDGCVSYAITNCPGNWHDSVVSRTGGLYDILIRDVPNGFFVVADSAFPVHGDVGQKIKRCPKHGEIATQSIIGLSSTQLEDLSKMRQSAEWGNRALEGSFPRLKEVFPWEEGGFFRSVVITNCVHLVNLRARLIGPSQIRSVWMPWLRCEWGFE